MAGDSADDVNVGIALSTALLLLGYLDQNAEMSEFENYALMLQRFVQVSVCTWYPVFLSRFHTCKKIFTNFCLLYFQAIQHAHSFSIQSFENREKLVEAKREISNLQKINKGLQSKMKKLEDQAEAAIKAQNAAEEKAESAEAIRKVAES